MNGNNTLYIPQYQVYLTRNETGVVIEASTNSTLTTDGLDRVEIFMNVHNYSTSARGAQTVLFNFFSNGGIRAWNWPSNKQTQLHSGSVAFSSWTYNGSKIENTVTISETGLNKFVIKIPYTFFNTILKQQFELEGLSTSYSEEKYGVNKNTPLGISMISGYKLSNTWYSASWNYNDIPDLANQNIGTIVYKNYPSDLAIVTPGCTVAQKYSVYADSLLSSFDILDTYVQATNVGVEGKTLANDMAKFDATGHSLVKFKPGQCIFSNRTQHVVPDACAEALKGLTFIYDAVDSGTTINITKSGYLLLIVDDVSLTNSLLVDWNCVLRSGVTGHGIVTKFVSMYAIWAEEGATITVPANAVIFTNNM